MVSCPLIVGFVYDDTELVILYVYRIGLLYHLYYMYKGGEFKSIGTSYITNIDTHLCCSSLVILHCHKQRKLCHQRKKGCPTTHGGNGEDNQISA